MTASLLIASALIVVALILAGTSLAADRLQMPPDEKRRFTGRAGTMLFAWIAFVVAIGATGILSKFPPAVGPVTLLSAILFARSPIGRLLETLPFHFLIGFQAFRILAEAYLFLRWKDGAIPVELTFEGMNFDIVTGIFALVLAFVLAKKPWRPLIWAWSLGGTALLITIVALHMKLARESVVHFPYVLLPGVLVWSAVVGHLIVYQKLLAKD